MNEDKSWECEGCESDSSYNPDNPDCIECMGIAEPDEIEYTEQDEDEDPHFFR